MKAGLSKFKAPTPLKMRKLGNALQSVSVCMAGYAVYEDYKFFAVCTLAFGMVGKFMTEFFSEET